jgi:hypothetical protein
VQIMQAQVLLNQLRHGKDIVIEEQNNFASGL